MIIAFKHTGTDFSALYAAQEWCGNNGISYAPLCRKNPIALMRGHVLIARWKNLTPKERRTADGRMTSGCFRNQDVTVEMFT